ncbi:MAG: hypothetical protein ACI9GM_001033 [Salibacteraceae bacterium]|jgi:hypothetical protein
MQEVWQANHKELLEKYPDLVTLVWAQVQKDFSMEALSLVNNNVTTLDAVYGAIYPEITQYIQSNFNTVMRLLYRIDISEAKVKLQMDLMPDDTAQALATLIVKREIQKVVLRKQFSSED